MARGALELLWDSCYEAGDAYVGTASDIEALVDWKGEPGALTQALLDAGAPEGFGFIEPVEGHGYRVHDLWHHAPDYVAKRRKRELDRQQKLAPLPVRRTAPNGGQCPPSSDCQIEVPPPPSPSPSPSPSPKEQNSLRTSSADIVGLWNQLVTPPIPQVTKLTTDRRAKIDARLKTFPDLSAWRTAILWVNGQDWCRAPGRGDHPNWTATLDWLVKNDGTMQRCLEKAAVKPPGSAWREWKCPDTPPCPAGTTINDCHKRSLLETGRRQRMGHA